MSVGAAARPSQEGAGPYRSRGWPGLPLGHERKPGQTRQRDGLCLPVTGSVTARITEQAVSGRRAGA